MPSHNCINNFTMFSFQGASEFQKNSLKPQLLPKFQSVFLKWWRVPGSNRWPPACKAGALPAELTPHLGSPLFEVVGQNDEPTSDWIILACARVFVRAITHHLSLTFSEEKVVGQNGLEPSTSRLSVVCSSQLSYWPVSAPHLLRYILLSSVPSKLNNALSHYTLYWP